MILTGVDATEAAVTSLKVDHHTHLHFPGLLSLELRHPHRKLRGAQDELFHRMAAGGHGSTGTKPLTNHTTLVLSLPHVITTRVLFPVGGTCECLMEATPPSGVGVSASIRSKTEGRYT